SHTAVRETGDRTVLALGQQGIHPRGAQLELEDSPAVQPVLAVIAAEDDGGAVPFTDWRQPFSIVGSDQIVRRPGAVGRPLTALLPVVVEDLILEPEGGGARRLLAVGVRLGFGGL